MQRLFIYIIIGIGIIGGTTFVIAQNKSASKNISSVNISPEPDSTNLLPETNPDSSVPSVLAPVSQATHIPTPDSVKAIYVSSWVAATPSIMKRINQLIDTTEVNAVVLDIKDATGRVSFLTHNPIVNETASPENCIKNIDAFINELHSRNVYVIGRISTFQDPYLTKVRPEWALMKKSDGTVWKDRKGLSFLDPGNTNVWEYTVALAEASYDVGFDEINFDYIRYPSDGIMTDINYNLTEGQTRADTLEKFYAHLHQRLRIEKNMVTSADLFGLTTSEKTDMGIGQVLERALPYFDFIGPMVYPSHYAPGEYGIAKPAENPYAVVMRALSDASKKITAMKNDSSLPQEFRDRVSFQQIRPWIQDFDMGAVYDKEKVQAQMKAVYDSGLSSWMMWDPANKYTPEAYALE